MSQSRTAWLFRPGISRRIVLTMVLSLFAIQAQAFLQISVFSRPVLRLTGIRWLAEATATTARDVFALPADQRAAHLARLASSSQLRFAWSPERPDAAAGKESNPFLARLSTTLNATLGNEANAIEVRAIRLSGVFPVQALRVELFPGMPAADFGESPVGHGEPDVLIPANVWVAVQGPDKTWLSVSPVAFTDTGFPGPLPFTPLLAAGLIIGCVSILTARRIVAPLDRLVHAAERIGTSREPVQITPYGLHEFGAVARAFEEMQVRLLRFVDDRTQMLAAISHDLRTALTRLRIAAETEPPAGEGRRSAIVSEIDEMQAMVDSTLAFARGEAQAKPSQMTDVAALLISIVDTVSDAGHVCTYAGPDHVEMKAHPLSLKRAFGNLIDNAIKYGNEARVAVDVDPRRVRIAIEDSGPGIASELRDQAFAPFRRLDPSRSGEIPGAGLGLTIARDAIQSHGGTIVLDSANGYGLKVVIELPLDAQSASSRPTADSDPYVLER